MSTYELPRSRQYAAGEYSRSLDAYFKTSTPHVELTLDAEDRSKLFLPVVFSRRKIGRHGQELKPPRIQLG